MLSGGGGVPTGAAAAGIARPNEIGAESSASYTVPVARYCGWYGNCCTAASFRRLIWPGFLMDLIDATVSRTFCFAPEIASVVRCRTAPRAREAGVALAASSLEGVSCSPVWAVDFAPPAIVR